MTTLQTEFTEEELLLDAAVSEQIARRVTMKQATENADEIIKDISSEYNRARHAFIVAGLQLKQFAGVIDVKDIQQVNALLD